MPAIPDDVKSKFALLRITLTEANVDAPATADIPNKSQDDIGNGINPPQGQDYDVNSNSDNDDKVNKGDERKDSGKSMPNLSANTSGAAGNKGNEMKDPGKSMSHLSANTSGAAGNKGNEMKDPGKSMPHISANTPGVLGNNYNDDPLGKNLKTGKSEYNATGKFISPGVFSGQGHAGIKGANSNSSWKTSPLDQNGEKVLGVQEERPFQLGDPYEEWLSNIEKLFIHFFLVIFDSGSPASKVMLEMFPLEASAKIEETFRILHKIDLEIYKDLEHVVFLAENWVTHKIDNEVKENALTVISEYMQKCAGEGYTLLTTEDRLQYLCSFVKSLEQLGELPKRMASIVNNFVKNSHGSEDNLYNPENNTALIKRPISPRVKPGSHYARVVANILCNRPCGNPVEAPDVYADRVAKKYFESTLIRERELQVYIDALYGSKYAKTDLFDKINPNLYRRRLNPSHIDPMNRLCLLPLYTESYMFKVRNGTCCPRKRKSATGPPSGYVSPRGHFHRFKVLSDSSEEWEHNLAGRRTKKRPGYFRGPYGGYIDRTYRGGKYRKDRPRDIDTDSDSDAWEHDKRGRRTKEKKGYKRKRLSEQVWYHDKYGNRTNLRPGYKESDYYSKKSKRNLRNISSDSDSDAWEHDKKGKRTKIKPGYSKYKEDKGKSRKKRHIESDSDSTNWEHDRKGKRTKRKPGAKYKSERKRQIDTDSDSDNWEHDKKGKRTKVKPGREFKDRKSKKKRNIESDSDSDNWEHDKKGKRTKVKPGREFKDRKSKKKRNIESDSDSDNWEHDKRGNRTKVKPGREYKDRKKKRKRNIESDSDSDNWEHDKRGNRTKVKPGREYKNYDHRGKKRNIESDSDSDNWEHDKKGKRTKAKPGREYKNYDRKSRKKRNISSDSDSDNWEHDKKGNRTKAKSESALKKERFERAQLERRKKKFVYPKRRERRLKSINSDSDSEGWEHDEQGKRKNRKANYKPRKAKDSDSDSDAWIHDEGGKRTKRKPGYKPRKNITSDSDSDGWEHDLQGKRTKRVKGYVPRKGISSDSDSSNWEHDKKGKRTARKKRKHGRSKRNAEKKDKNKHLGDGDAQNKENSKNHPLDEHGKKAKKMAALGYNLRQKGKARRLKELQDKASSLGNRGKGAKFKGFSNKESLDSIEGSLLTFMTHLLEDEDGDDDSPPSTAGDCLEGGAGDPGINTCWELSEMWFKSPFNKNLIPSPENILHHIEQTIPRARWPKGTPVATRRYPNGALFCAMYENGSGLIFYPHGGLAVVISSPRPFNRVLVIRDPLDGFFLFDKAIMANLHSIGHGSVFDMNGVLRTQYNIVGGYHMDKNVDQFSQRWRWHRGGIRLILKLNKYLRLHISKRDNISLVFNGNKRGVHLNVGAGKKVVLLKAHGFDASSKGPARLIHASQLPSRSTTEVTPTMQTHLTNSPGETHDHFDKKFHDPVLGFVDNEHQDNSDE